MKERTFESRVEKKVSLTHQLGDRQARKVPKGEFFSPVFFYYTTPGVSREKWVALAKQILLIITVHQNGFK